MPVSARWLARQLGRKKDDVLPSAPAKLVVGLGNPGVRYTRNRHNIGFMVLDELAAAERAAFARQRFNARLTEIKIGESRVLLAKPQTFMNLSGTAVGKLAAFFRVPRADMLIVYDDLDLPLGRMRLRPQGSAGGHHGMESIINYLGGTDIPRLRIGIGRPESRQDVGHVLGDFGADEKRTLGEVLDRAAAAVRAWATDGIIKAMNEFNA